MAQPAARTSYLVSLLCLAAMLAIAFGVGFGGAQEMLARFHTPQHQAIASLKCCAW